MVRGASPKYFSGSHSQKCHEIDSAVATVVKPFVVYGVAIDCGGQRRIALFERLNSGTFVKTVEIFWLSLIEADEVFHLGEEVGIGDLKEVFSKVRLQRMCAQYVL